MSEKIISCHFGNSIINLNDKPHHCSSCGKSFVNFTQLENHACSTNSAASFVCYICNKRFGKKSSYNDHILSHSGKSKKIRKRQHKKRYEKHRVKFMDVDNSDKLYTCEKCNKKFYLRKNFESHKISAHMTLKINISQTEENLEKLYACDKCEKKFYLKKTLDCHVNFVHSQMNAHSFPKLYTCKECDKKFYQKTTLDNHTISLHNKENTEISENLYTCDECDKKFCLENDLESHINYMHLDKSDKFHTCKQCNKIFCNKNNLDTHMSTEHELSAQSNQLNHLCLCCNMKFDNKEEYDEHVLGHSGPTVFFCSVCKIQFLTLSELSNHICVPIETKNV